MIEWSAYASRQLAQVGLAQRIAFAGGIVNDVIFGFSMLIQSSDFWVLKHIHELVINCCFC